MKRLYIKEYKITMIKVWYEKVIKTTSFTASEGKKELKVKYPAALIKHIPTNRKQKF